MSKNSKPDPKGNSDDDIKVGALADGYANSAINSTEVDDGSTGYIGVANGDNRDNTDSSVDIDLKADVKVGNGDNRDNSYDWDYTSNTTTTTNNETDVKTDYDWSYDNKTITDIKTTDIKTTDIKTTEIKTDVDISDSFNSSSSSSSNYSSSYSSNKADTDFAVIEDVKDFANLGVAGNDLTFNLGDDFSFTLDVDNILNGSLNGEGNDTGFSVVQANHLADQDIAYSITMNNNDAQNHLKADGGTAYGKEGIEMDGKNWDLKAGDDIAGTSTADASAILANSGFHMQVVQGANLLSNTVDSSVIGGNSSVSNVGEDTDS